MQGLSQVRAGYADKRLFSHLTSSTALKLVLAYLRLVLNPHDDVACIAAAHDIR